MGGPRRSVGPVPVQPIDVYGLVRWFEYLGNGRILCNATTSLLLFDCATDSILVDSAITEPAYRAAHTGDGEKVYLVRSGRLEARSSSSLALLATVDWDYYDPLHRGTFVAHSDTTRKLYWFVDDSVLAVDAASDTVAARVTTDVRCNCACLDHTGKYLFCSSSMTEVDSCLRVYDTQSDSLVAAYPHLPPIASVVASPEQQCIYVGCRDVILVYPDTPPGVEEASNVELRTTDRGVTVVSGVLFLPPTPYSPSSSLLSVDGRKVLELRPGANDVSGLGPGVYFVREEPQASSSKPQAVHKIVIVK